MLDLSLSKIGGVGTGESLCRLPPPGPSPAREVLLADRAFGTPPQLADAQNKGRLFVVRFTWNNLPLYDPATGENIDPREKLEGLQPGAILEFSAEVRPKHANPFMLRIIVIRKNPDAGEKSRCNARRESQRKGHRPRAETLFLADFVTLATNLPSENLDPSGVAQAYRWRWQIEREFRRLKSTTLVRRLDNFKDEAVEAYLLALLIAWLLANKLARERAFFPWGYPLHASSTAGTDRSRSLDAPCI
jgi:IS4 transposase